MSLTNGVWHDMLLCWHCVNVVEHVVYVWEEWIHHNWIFSWKTWKIKLTREFLLSPLSKKCQVERMYIADCTHVFPACTYSQLHKRLVQQHATSSNLSLSVHLIFISYNNYIHVRGIEGENVILFGAVRLSILP